MVRCSRDGLAWCTLFTILLAIHPAVFSEEGSGGKFAMFSKRPLLCGAHRGGKALWPENTVFAYKSAAAKWPDILLEGDVQLTADGQVVILHDDTVDRTTNGTGRIADLKFDQVKALDAGYRFTSDGGATFPHRGKGITIPLFSEALEAVPNGRFLIEMKDQAGIAEAAVAVLRDKKALDRVILASMNADLMSQARRIEPKLLACYDIAQGTEMLAQLRGGDWARYAPAAEMLAIGSKMVEDTGLKPEEIRAIRDKGICTLVYTVNDPEAMRRFLDMGFSSILTDRPDVLQDVLKQYQAAQR
jgi:glycerophosphoryl diester phosphodiesterase